MHIDTWFAGMKMYSSQRHYRFEHAFWNRTMLFESWLRNGEISLSRSTVFRLLLWHLFLIVALHGGPILALEKPLSLNQSRVTVTGYDKNRPKDYPGIGDFGWAGNIAQLADGRLMLVHQWGYWHSSFSEPRLIESKLAVRWRKQNWPLDFKAPTGGRSMVTYSSDRGKTWTRPVTLIDHPQDDSPYGLLRCLDNSLLCLISVQAPWYGFPEAPASMKHLLNGLNTQQFYIRSTDEGQSWTEPVALKTPAKFYARSHAQPIQINDQSILWPLYCSDSGTDGRLYGAIHRSTDSGRSWHLWSTIRRDEINCDEPAIVQLANGQILLVCRPDGGVLHSDDNGISWKESGTLITQGRIKAPRLFVLSDGTVVCVATYRRLCVFISTDHGQHWSTPIVLDKSSYGYPGGFLMKDDSMLISYVESGRAPSRIYAIRFCLNPQRSSIELMRIDHQSGIHK